MNSLILLIVCCSTITVHVKGSNEDQVKLNEMVDLLITYVLEDSAIGDVYNNAKYAFAGSEFTTIYTEVRQTGSSAINHHSWKREGDVDGYFDGEDWIRIRNMTWRIPSPAWSSGVSVSNLLKFSKFKIPLNYTFTVKEVDLAMTVDIDKKKKAFVWGDFSTQPYPLRIVLPPGKHLEYKFDIDCPQKVPKTVKSREELCADVEVMMREFISRETYSWFRASAQFTIEKAYQLWF